MKPDYTRREFLKGGAAAAVLAGSLPAAAQEDAAAPEGKPGANTLRVLLRAPDGSPLPENLVKTMIVRDAAGDPLPVAMSRSRGECQVELPAEPAQIGCLLDVPEFGSVWCYSDNEGRDWRGTGELNFITDAARTRFRRVFAAADAAGQPLRGDGEYERDMAQAGAVLRAAPHRIAEADAWRALACGLRAGERLVLEGARRRIARLPAPRRDFLFGCAANGRDRSPAYSGLFTGAFNFAVLSWYIWRQTAEPEEGRIEYGRMDESLKWCADRGLAAKGFGYVYLTKGAMPEWLRDWPYEKMLPVYRRVVEETTRRYAGRLQCCEIINEAHDVSNLPHFNHAQLVELTREACAAAGRGAPGMPRLINNCCLWAEYARRPAADGTRRWSPWRYLHDCVKDGAAFERIGLQLYYPRHDLFEIARMLNRFKSFGRPLHISEISCNSAPGLDPDSMRPKDDVPGWHGPWNESMQADWLEGIYTLCYSMPEFEAVCWWDFADYPGHFWPHGGLLRADFTPKESYHRLLDLRRRWGVPADGSKSLQSVGHPQ